jgi:hypothetical protein
MLPSEIGHAAAYEAYRTWTHHSPMYEPLSGDMERQREALVGLAVAEGVLLSARTSPMCLTIDCSNSLDPVYRPFP